MVLLKVSILFIYNCLRTDRNLQSDQKSEHINNHVTVTWELMAFKVNGLIVYFKGFASLPRIDLILTLI